MLQVIEIVAYSETSKFRSKLCSVSTGMYSIMINVSSARSRVFTQYNRCVNCRRRDQHEKFHRDIGIIDRCTQDEYHNAPRAHACKYHCDISRTEKALIALDYHLIVRLKNPKLLAARFVYGVTNYKTQHDATDISVVIQNVIRDTPSCPDVAELHERYHRYHLRIPIYAACYAGDFGVINRIIGAAQTLHMHLMSSQARVDFYRLFTMACTRSDTHILEHIIVLNPPGMWYVYDVQPAALNCLQHYGVNVKTQHLGETMTMSAITFSR